MKQYKNKKDTEEEIRDMIKELDKNLEINNKKIIRKNENKCNNTTVVVSNYATYNAITLIALVITIIVLLILAGVTINLILGQKGLLQQSQDATDRYKQAETDETNSLSNIVEKLDSISSGNASGENQGGNIENTYDMIEGVPVPKGFTHVEGTKETGFVIQNNEDKNEFVWIPTDLVPYQTYDWNKGITATDFTEYYVKDDVENTRIVSEITKSVSDHNGYYISRYEAGVTTKRTSRTETSKEELPNPIFRATSTSTPIYAYNYVTWDDAIYIGNRLYNKEKGNNVTSRLINARGWDTALKFIETIGEDKDETYPTNSTGKGWHGNNNSNNENREIGKSVDLTNATVPNKLKNIYDMGGNMYEWTADIYTPPDYANAGRAYRRWRFL